MNFRYSLATALRALAVNRSRSLLTILGIVIGITAIIVVMAIGQGAQGLIMQEIQGIGSRTIAIVPGRDVNSPSSIASSFFINSLTINDLKALEQKSNVPTLAAITPVLTITLPASAGGQTYQATIDGVAPSLQEIMNVSPSQGSFFTNSDVTDIAQVAVIGSKVKQNLFGNQSAIGQRIKINNYTFVVVGTISANGSSPFINFDQTVFIPWSTMQDYILGIKYFQRIIAQADSVQNINRTVNDITLTLRSDHNITDPTKDDFTIQTQVSLANTVGLITTALTLLLVGVTGISLIVGGVGIMNIMLVSVTERTREIGLRKAIGATDHDILMQFLFEAILLTGIGGIIGIALGTFLSAVIALAIQHFSSLNWQFSFPYLAAVIGIVVSAGIGLVFGIYPARQAAKKSPIEALRYE